MRRAVHHYEERYLEAIATSFGATAPRAADAAVAYARNLLENDLPPLFDQAHLAVVTGVSSQVIGLVRFSPDHFYSQFRIAKRGGGSRVISVPTPLLRVVQSWLQRNVTRRLWSHDACHGFVRGRGIVSNARGHVGNNIIIKLDIRDFFGSVTRRQVYRTFRRVGYTRELAELMVDLCCLDGSLPQGAPTSPDLANFVAYRLDARLSGLAAHNDLTYTRYADDLTFSGAHIRPRTRRAIEHIMRAEGFAPNDTKLRYASQGARQTVTGVVVNEKLNWPRTRRRWLRQEVHYLLRFGYDGHLAARGYDRARYKEFLYGHVYALNMVRPDEAEMLLDALARVDWPY
jgi:RNA-directed DNA polymerase